VGELTDVRPVPDRRVHAGCDAARSKSPACDELGRDQNELQETLGRIVDLHDFAPVSYLTLDLRGFHRRREPDGDDAAGRRAQSVPGESPAESDPSPPVTCGGAPIVGSWGPGTARRDVRLERG
jgi:hypothetical protein